MPDAPEQITLVKDGNAIRVPIDKAGNLLREGYTVESAGMREQREEGELKAERAPGLLASTALGAARGLTFGGSDVVGNALGQRRYLKEAKEAHPIGSALGNIAGGVGALALTGGGSAETTLGKLAVGAGQGAEINAGSYISDVALGDRDLSAEGFVGSMGKGALWGAGAEVGILGAGKSLAAARKMFPKGELSKVAVDAAESHAASEIAGARQDAEGLRDAARQRMRGIREEVGSDPRLRAEHEAVASDAARQVAAEANPQAAVEAAVGAPAAPPDIAPSLMRRPDLVEKATEAAGKVAGKKAAQAIAPAEEAATEEPNSLLAKLQATKQRLDQGATLAEVGKPTAIEDAVNAHVAKTHPEMDRIVRAERQMSEASKAVDEWLGGEGAAPEASTRKQAVKDWVKQTRPTEAGWYSKVPENSQMPGTLEGSAGMPRGVQYEFRGGELDRALGELDITSKFERGRTLAEKVLSPREGEKIKIRGEGYEPKIKGKNALEASPGKPGAAVTAQDVIDTSNAQLADRGMPPLDEQVKAAIRAKVGGQFGDANLTKAIDSLSKFEAAHSELAEALGPHAPPSALPRAQAYKAAADEATGKAAETTARTTAAIERAPGSLSKAAHMAENLGQAAEVLHMLGVNVPDPKDIPIVGPLLSMYLKAKVGLRMLGKVGGSPEAVIAGKAAGMRNKIAEAVSGALEAAQNGVRRASPAAIPTATALGHALFRSPDSKRAAASTAAEMFAARTAELAEASRPGAIEQEIQRRVGASDPAVMDAIADTTRRKLAFLDGKRPRPMNPEIGEQGWTPDKQRMADWARYVQAADHPEEVFAQLGRGQMPSHEALETVRTVYPRLWQEAQVQAAQALSKGTTDLPYAARVRLSVVFGVPFDSSVSKGFQAMVQMPAQPPHAPPMGAPTLKTDVKLPTSTENRVDRS